MSSYDKKMSKGRKHGARATESAAPIEKVVYIFRESSAIRPLEAVKPPAGEGPRLKVVLIDEGLGNRRNMNFYSAEAIASAAKMFEGKPAFVNHPSESEESDLPERDLGKQFGYYKNLRVEEIDGKKACVGELHFDLSELGRQMYAKGLTAVHYQKEFPGSEGQYLGLSVLGGGVGATKTLDPKEDKTGTLKEFDEPVEVNFVTEFVESESCDAVTRAGRGGRVLAVIEDATGHSKEGSMKKLKAILAKVQESAKKATGEAKKVLEAQAKDLAAAITALKEEAAAPATEESYEALFGKQEGESDEDHMARLHGMAKHLASKLHPKEEAEDGADGDGADDADEPDDSKKKPSAEESDRNVRAVKSYMAEAGVPETALSEDKIKRLSLKPWKEVKAEIDDVALLVESVAGSIEQPVAHLGAGRLTRETARGGDRNKAFVSSFKEAR